MPADRRADGFLRVCRERGIEGEVLLSDRLSYGSMHYESYIEKGLLEQDRKSTRLNSSHRL